MINLSSSVKELLKGICEDESEVAHYIDRAQTGLSQRYSFTLPVSTKFGVPITVTLSHEDCIIEFDYNKWYERDDFDKFELPKNSAVVEVTDTDVLMIEESKFVSELDSDTVKFMIIDLNGVIE